MKVGLNFDGKGYKATIHNEDGDDDIILKAKKYPTEVLNGASMTITQGRDIIALDKNDIIALRDYLVQVTPTFEDK